jgi:hypothetical protein
MRIGGLRVELFISDSTSLKHKRAVLKSIKDRIRNNFNVSIAEIGDNDKWQKSILGIAAVGNEKKFVNGILDKVLDFIRQNGEVQVLNFEMEIL